MFKIKVIIICLFMFGCKNDQLIEESNIDKVLVIENKTKEIKYTLNNKATINSFIKKINKGSKKLIKFYALYTIEIIYKDGNKKVILVNSKNFKIDGLTYQLSTDVIGFLK